MRRFLRFVVACTVLALPPAASSLEPKEIEQELKKAYEGKVVFLRGFYKGNLLRYDPEGNLRSGGKPGPWTLTGKVEITRVLLGRDKLELWGNRVQLFYDQNKEDFRQMGGQDKVTIEMSRKAGPWEHLSILRGLGRIFLPEEELVEAVPDYWKSFLSKDEPPQAVQPGEPVQLGPGGHGAVYRVGGSVSAPVCTSCPSPEPTNAARSARLNALVVLWATIDEEGRTKSVRIQKPAGLGLDDAAVATAKKWKFKPATRFGKPVPVALAVEVKFNFE